MFIAAARLLHWFIGVHESSGTECKVVSAATDPRWQHIARSHSRPPQPSVMDGEMRPYPLQKVHFPTYGVKPGNRWQLEKVGSHRT